jgi:iron complex transport system substrate-binding protein
LKQSGWAIIALAVAAGVALSLWLSRAQKPEGEALAPGLSSAYRRIICMAPNIVETVFALGAGDRVVGVSQYTAYPPEAREKPSVGALFNPDLERIVALKPDLVIVQEKHEKVEALCQSRGIRVLRMNMLRVSTILEGVRALGDVLGRREQAKALADKIRSDLDAVRKRVEGKPRIRVFLCLGHTPGSLKGMFTVGKTSFLTEMIEIAGGENIFGDVENSYPQVSAESLLARAPDVIIETYPSEEMPESRRKALLADWQTMPGLPAVRSGRVHFVTEDYVVVPGPRVGMIAGLFAGLIHSEATNAR